MTSIQAEMDLRQFGEYNQFKILRQTASRESKKYFALFQSESKETVELFFGMSLFLILKTLSGTTVVPTPMLISTSCSGETSEYVSQQ